MAEVGNLQARLTADVSDFVRGMKSASAESSTATKAIVVNIEQVRAAAAIGEAFADLGARIQEAGAASAAIGQAVAGLGAGFAEAKEKLNEFQNQLAVTTGTEIFERLKNLATEIEFKGPLSDMRALADSMDVAAAKATALGKAAALSGEAIEIQVGEAIAKVKEQFKEDLKLKVSLKAAEATRQLAELAEAAQSLPTPLIPVTAEQERAVAGISAGLRNLGTGLRGTAEGAGIATTSFARVATAMLTISGASTPAAGGLIRMASAFGGVAAAAAVAGGALLGAFLQRLNQFQAVVDKTNKRIDDASKEAAASTERLRDIRVEIETEAAVAGLDEIEAASERARLSFAGTGVSAGRLKAELEAIGAAQTEVVFQRIAAESRAAGLKLSESIRTGATDALAEIEKLKAGLETVLPENVAERLKALGEDVRFEGLTVDFKALDDALQQNEESLEALGKKAGLTEEFIRSQVQQTNELIKQRFEQAGQQAGEKEAAIKFGVDVDDAKLNEIFGVIASQIDNISAGLPPVVLDASIERAETKLEELRRKAMQLAEGSEARIQADADVEAAEAKLAELKARKEEATAAATVKVDADTSAADAKLDSLEARMAALQAGTLPGALAGPNVQVFGVPASRQEIEAMFQDAQLQITQALREGNLELVQAILANVEAFEAQFKDAFRLFGLPTGVASSLRFQLQGVLPQDQLGGGTPAFDLSAAIQDFKAQQAGLQTDGLAIQTDSLSTQKQQLDETRLQTDILSQSLGVAKTLTASFGGGPSRGGRLGGRFLDDEAALAQETGT